MLSKHFASKNQLPGLSVSGTLVKNGLNVSKFLWECLVSSEPVLYKRYVDEIFLSLTSKNYELLFKNFLVEA